MDQPSLRGIVTPLLTPFSPDGTIASALYVDHARHCLAEGSHFLSPFGTTGEAANVPVAARKEALEHLIETGAARPDQLLPGTGLTSLGDTVDLTRHAVELGVSAVMLLPPYFYTDAGDAGLYRYVAGVIERIADPRVRIVLYHIPKYAGVGYSPALTQKLALDFPGVVVGYKDSGGKWAHTAQILRAAPQLSVFPGSETMLPQAMASGGAGCISASCNVNAREIRALYDALTEDRIDEARDLALQVSHLRKLLEAAGLIGGAKSIVAARTGEPGWLRVLPPLTDAPGELSPELSDWIRSRT